jgi:hypothetical protein
MLATSSPTISSEALERILFAYGVLTLSAETTPSSAGHRRMRSLSGGRADVHQQATVPVNAVIEDWLTKQRTMAPRALPMSTSHPHAARHDDHEPQRSDDGQRSRPIATRSPTGQAVRRVFYNGCRTP